jgi:hypothetical protein
MPHPTDLCAYCVTTVLTGSEKPEHPIPASLGASLTVPTVCDKCNEWAGREIDQPFLKDQLLRQRRSMLDQRDPRRGLKARRPASELLTGITEAGDRVTFDHVLGRPVMGYRIVELDDGRQQVRAGSRRRIACSRNARKRAAAEGKEVKVESVERDSAQPEVNVTMTLRTDVWRREAAKIALAVASAVYPPEGRVSADADRLRESMHGRDRTQPDGQAPPLVRAILPDGHPFAAGDDYLLWFMRLGDGATYLSVTLFGNITFGVPVDTTGGEVHTSAWRLEWREPRTDGSTTFEDMVMVAVQRSAPPELLRGPEAPSQ